MTAENTVPSGTTKPETIRIFDTTLRDGEQSPGASMTLDQKLHIAEVLRDLGVDIIEAGFAIASDGDFECISNIAKAVQGPTIASLARAAPGDIDRAAKAVEASQNPRIHTFIATSELHMRVKLQMEPEAVLEAIDQSVRRARSRVDDVEWSAEDASRTDPDFLARAVETAINAGATTINLPDTVGYALPHDYGRMFAGLRERITIPEWVVLSTHCHNDLGLAVANSLAGVESGARQIECTINGIGERAGNAALEEIAMAIRTRKDALPYVTNINTQEITRASRLVAAVTGFNVQNNKAIVGANAFAHESGIHQDGVLKDAETYEIMTPESVGLNRSRLVMGKHSGRHAFKEKLEELGYQLSDNAFMDCFQRFKALGDHKKEIFDADIIALAEDQIVTEDQRINLIALNTQSMSTGKAISDITLSIDGEEQSSVVYGTGPVDAAFNAIKSLIDIKPHLVLFQVSAVTQGTDAQAECTVRLDLNGTMTNGQSAHEDTITAAARAYIVAVNKLLVKQKRINAETAA